MLYIFQEPSFLTHRSMVSPHTCKTLTVHTDLLSTSITAGGETSFFFLPLPITPQHAFLILY